jgi:hypothetical protein
MSLRLLVAAAALAAGLGFANGASAGEIANGLSANGLSANGLVINGLVINGLATNGSAAEAELSAVILPDGSWVTLK